MHDINIIGDEDGGRQIAEIGNRYVAIHSRSLYPQSLKIEVFVKYQVWAIFPSPAYTNLWIPAVGIVNSKINAVYVCNGIADLESNKVLNANDGKKKKLCKKFQKVTTEIVTEKNKIESTGRSSTRLSWITNPADPMLTCLSVFENDFNSTEISPFWNTGT